MDLFGNDDGEVREPTELYLVCPTCRVMSFNLIAVVPEVGQTKFEVHCAGCNGIVTASENNPDFKWAKELPKTPPAGKAMDLLGYANTIATGSADLARKRVQRHIDRWTKDDTLMILIAYNTDDESTLWINFESEKQQQWVLRKLAEIEFTVREWKNG